MADFSALHKKLAFEKLPQKLVLHAPKNMPELAGISCDTRPIRTYDLVMAFVFDLDDMEQAVHTTDKEKLLKDGGYLYLAYPKKGNREYPQFIERDSIFPRLAVDEADGFVPDTHLKFTKMVALNATFTVVGLRYMADKTKSGKDTTSNIEDYVPYLPVLRTTLEQDPQTLARYEALTPGYQKNWARYVYSAKTETTQQKRLVQMAQVLAAGYKSIDLYRQAKK